MRDRAAKRRFIPRALRIGMDPVIVARQGGELVDQLLADEEIIRPVGPLIADQAAHGGKVLAGNLPLRGRCRAIDNNFGRSFGRCSRDHLGLRRIDRGIAQQSHAAGPFVEHRTHPHADLQVFGRHADHGRVQMRALIEFHDRQQLRHFIAEFSQRRHPRHGVAVQLARAGDIAPGQSARCALRAMQAREKDPMGAVFALLDAHLMGFQAVPEWLRGNCRLGQRFVPGRLAHRAAPCRIKAPCSLITPPVPDT